MSALEHAPAATVNDELRPCPQCESRRATLLRKYSLDPWRIVQCDGCHFVYLENAPAYERLAQEFAWEKTYAAETARRKSRYPLLSWLDRLTRWRLAFSRRDRSAWFSRTFTPGRVLDVGCGAGQTMPPEFTPFGIEVSQALAAVASKRMAARGGRVINAPALQGIAEFPANHFSGVILQSFLEHERNPKPLLREVARVLTPDGVVFIRVPNYGSVNRRVMGARWCGFRSPDHVNYFTLSSLRRMAQDCGLRTRLLNALVLPCDDNIKAALSKA